MYYHKQLFSVDRVALFHQRQLHRVKSHRVSHFPHGHKTECSASSPITHAAGQKDLVLMWSTTIKHLALQTKVLIDLNAKLCSSIHKGKFLCASFVVKGISTTVWSASFGRKVAMCLMRPRKLLTSVANQGTGHCIILSYLDDCGLIPHAEIWWPRKSNYVRKNFHFFSI